MWAPEEGKALMYTICQFPFKQKPTYHLSQLDISLNPFLLYYLLIYRWQFQNHVLIQTPALQSLSQRLLPRELTLNLKRVGDQTPKWRINSHYGKKRNHCLNMMSLVHHTKLFGISLVGNGETGGGFK